MKQVKYVSSDLMNKVGVKHGWFMRYGGVSEGLFESLNGKKGIGDPDRNVIENRLRALAALCHPELDSGSNCKKDSCLRRNDKLAHILHEFKTNILIATESGEFNGYDACITIDSNLVLSQTTADCGSIVVAAKDGGEAALIHGSWHTLRDKIICDTIAKMTTHPRDLISAVGPMICQNCYEFGPEASTLFDEKYLKTFNSRHSSLEVESSQKNSAISTQNILDPLIKSEDDKKGAHEGYHVDLKMMVIDQLKEAGITQIDDLNICTLEDERFFSHRRAGAHSGRFLTLVNPTKR